MPVLLLPVICHFISFFLFLLLFFLYYLSVHHCCLLPGYYYIFVNQWLLINLLYHNFKSIFSLLHDFYLLLLLTELCFSLVFVSLLFFWTHKWSPNISSRHHEHCNMGLAFDCLVLSFSRVSLCDHP